MKTISITDTSTGKRIKPELEKRKGPSAFDSGPNGAPLVLRSSKHSLVPDETGIGRFYTVKTGNADADLYYLNKRNEAVRVANKVAADFRKLKEPPKKLQGFTNAPLEEERGRNAENLNRWDKKTGEDTWAPGSTWAKGSRSRTYGLDNRPPSDPNARNIDFPDGPPAWPKMGSLAAQGETSVNLPPPVMWPATPPWQQHIPGTGGIKPTREAVAAWEQQHGPGSAWASNTQTPVNAASPDTATPSQSTAAPTTTSLPGTRPDYARARRRRRGLGSLRAM